MKVPVSLLARHGLSPGAKLLWALIYDYTKISGNGVAWPAVRRLMDDLGINSRDTLDHWRKELQKHGLIEVVPGKGRAANRYTLCNVPDFGTLDENVVSRNPGHCVPKSGTLDARSVPKSGTDQEHRPRTNTKNKKSNRKSINPDPWQQALDAMTGDTLKTEKFKDAWISWIEDRKERKLKNLTTRGIKGQIRKLETFGHDGAIQSIENSIAGPWVGLFDPEERRGSTPRRGQPQGTRTVSRRPTAEERGEYPEDDVDLPFL